MHYGKQNWSNENTANGIYVNCNHFIFCFSGIICNFNIFSGLKKEVAISQEKDALNLVSKIANSPEFSCGAAYGGQKVNCIDLDKIMGLIKNNETYGNFWKVKSLEIRKIYPVEEEIICNSQNYPECNYFKIYSKGGISEDQSSFATLCRKEFEINGIYNKCEIGKILIGS